MGELKADERWRVEHNDILLTAAEVSISLAGFTGIIVIFARGRGVWSTVDRFRIKAALGGSVGAAFLALLPSALILLELEGATLWRVSSGLFIAYVVSVGIWQLPDARQLSEEDIDTLKEPGRMFLLTIGWTTIVVHAANVVGVGMPPQVGIYFLGLFLFMIQAAFLFLRIVFVRPAGE